MRWHSRRHLDSRLRRLGARRVLRTAGSRLGRPKHLRLLPDHVSRKVHDAAVAKVTARDDNRGYTQVSQGNRGDKKRTKCAYESTQQQLQLHDLEDFRHGVSDAAGAAAAAAAPAAASVEQAREEAKVVGINVLQLGHLQVVLRRRSHARVRALRIAVRLARHVHHGRARSVDPGVDLRPCREGASAERECPRGSAS